MSPLRWPAQVDPEESPEPSNPLLAHAVDPGAQLLGHPRPAVLLADFGMDGAHVRQQCLVAQPPLARLAGPAPLLTTPVLEVPADAHAQHLAAQAHRPAVLHRPDPGVLCRTSCAKYATAFFGVSRFIFTRASSASSLASPICGPVPVPGKGSTPRRRRRLTSIDPVTGIIGVRESIQRGKGLSCLPGACPGLRPAGERYGAMARRKAGSSSSLPTSLPYRAS